MPRTESSQCRFQSGIGNRNAEIKYLGGLFMFKYRCLLLLC